MTTIPWRRKKVDSLHLGSSKILVVYKGSKETDDYSYFLMAATEVPGVNYIYWDSHEFENRLGDLPKQRFLLYRYYKEPLLFKGNGYKELRDWIIAHAHDGLEQVSSPTLQLITQADIPALVLVCKDHEACAKDLETFERVRVPSHRMLTVYDPNPKDTPRVAGIEPEEYFPRVVIWDSKRGNIHQHKMIDEFSLENIQYFVEDYFQRRRHNHHYGEHTDDTVYTAVRTITTHNFERLVHQAHHNLLLLVHDGLEDKLMQDFYAHANWLHSHLHRSLRFAVLNQRDNVTPLPYYPQPTLLMVYPYRQTEHEVYGIQVIEEHHIDLKTIYEFLVRKGRYCIGSPQPGLG